MWAVGKSFTEDHKRKLSLSKNANAIEGTNLITGEIIEFPTRYDAKLNGFDVGKIGECCRNIKKSYKGYTWREIVK